MDPNNFESLDDYIILRALNNSLFKLTHKNTCKTCQNNEIEQEFTDAKKLVIIAPFTFNPQVLLKRIFENTSVENIVGILPSISCTFAFNIENLIYLHLYQINSSIGILCEIIKNKEFIKSLSKKIEDENVYDTLLNHITYNFKGNINVFIDCSDESLRLHFLNNLRNDFGSRIEFCNLSKLTMESEYCFKEIEDDPAIVGGAMAAKLLMGNEMYCLTRRDFADNKLDKFLFFE